MLWRTALLVLISGVAWGATYSATDTPQPVPAWGAAVSGIYVPGSDRVDDVSISLDLAAEDTEDLYVELFSPYGTRVVLHDGTTPFRDGIRTKFGDPFGSVAASPEGLSALEREGRGGMWLLLISDSGDSDAELLDWSIEFDKGTPATGICGTILDFDFLNATVTVSNPLVSPPAFITEVGVDGSGNYCVELPPGIYWVTAYNLHEFCDPITEFTESVMLTVVENEVTIFDFDFAEGAKGCGNGSNIVPPTVVGTVLDAETDEPIPTATVSLNSQPAVQTDGGVYFFVMPSDSGNDVSATAPGYAPSGAQLISGSGAPNLKDVFLTPLKGDLQVFILPTDAANAGGAWRLNGGANMPGETTVSDLPVGDYEVSFVDIPGWTTPDTATVSVSANTTTVYDGIYVRKTGSLQVSIQPPEAVAAGAQWRLDGGALRSSGDLVDDVAIGQHTVTFTPVSGWNTPASMNVNVEENTIKSITGTYGQGTGSLTVTISPEAALVAGAQWRLDGGPWLDSGTTMVDIPAGSHECEFKAMDGWNQAPTENVEITANQTAEHEGVYERIGSPSDINLDGFVNAVDVQLVINAVLGLPVGNVWTDVNDDNIVNAVDIQTVINAALSNKEEPFGTPLIDQIRSWLESFRRSYQRQVRAN